MECRRIGAAVALAAAIAVGAGADAAPRKKDAPLPASMTRLSDCRKLAEDAARLACYDREVGVLEQGIRSHDVAIVDRTQVRQTKRSLFGIPLPNIKLFDNDDEPDVKEITATLRSVGRNENGQLVFTLDDGAVWTQTDDFPLSGAVKAGQKVVLRRAALGSYFAKFEKTVGVRAKRLR